MIQIVASLTDDFKDVIYDRNMFIVQATADTKSGLVLSTIVSVFFNF
jgi:hypothetical protein